MIKYIIELWNPEKNKYIEIWNHHDYKLALIMFNKSYYVRHTRRLIRLEETKIIKAKKGEYN